MGSGCHAARLVAPLPLCVSSDQPSSRSDKQVCQSPKSIDDPSGSLLATERVVSGSGRTSGRLSSEVATQTRPVASAIGESSAPKPPHSSIDRMETVLRFARANRFQAKCRKEYSGLVKAPLMPSISRDGQCSMVGAGLTSVPLLDLL